VFLGGNEADVQAAGIFDGPKRKGQAELVGGNVEVVPYSLLVFVVSKQHIRPIARCHALQRGLVCLNAARALLAPAAATAAFTLWFLVTLRKLFWRQQRDGSHQTPH